MSVAPFFAIVAVVLQLNLWFRAQHMEPAKPTADLVERVLGAGSVVWFYLQKALVPTNLMFLYPEWHVDAARLQWWLALLASVAVTAVLWGYRQRWSRPLWLAWAYFYVALLPVLGLADVGFNHYLLVADHYQYAALIGVTAVLAAGWGILRRRVAEPGRLLADAMAIAVVGVLGVLSWQQNHLYVDAITLYQDALKKNPDAWIAHANLGAALSVADRSAEAIEHYRASLRINPEFRVVHHNLAMALARSGRNQEAIEQYRQALRFKPELADAHYNLASALAQAGEAGEAIEQYKEAVRLKPNFAEAHYNLGTTLLLQRRDLDEAIGHLQEAVRPKPNYPEAQRNLAIGLTRKRNAANATP